MSILACFVSTSSVVLMNPVVQQSPFSSARLCHGLRRQQVLERHPSFQRQEQFVRSVIISQRNLLQIHPLSEGLQGILQWRSNP